MKQPLITISIPTLNGEKFLEACLSAIASQTYKAYEINLIDGGSTDKTLQIAKKFGVEKILTCKESLLKARAEGVSIAKGDYTLLLDCDQVLKKDALEKAVALCQKEKYQMLVLEEDVYQPKTLLEKLFQQDRKLIHLIHDLSPFTGVLLPRFYQTSLLQKAFAHIPPDVLKDVSGQDHAIIYYEAWNLNKHVGILPDAVSHIEPASYIVMWRKFFRWGKTSAAAHTNQYSELLSKKERFRTGLFSKGMITSSLASIILLILKGVPYKLGYYSAKLRRNYA